MEQRMTRINGCGERADKRRRIVKERGVKLISTEEQ